MKRVIFILLGLVTVMFTACNDDNDSKEDNAVLKIVFDHSVKNDKLEFYKFKYQAKAGYPYKVVTLRYFTSEYKLYKDDGNTVDLDTFHYREADVEHEYTRNLIVKNIPAGTYDGIAFIHGLSEKYNRPISSDEPHSLPNKEEYLDMYWPWQEDGQYHYMKYEGEYIWHDDTLSFKLHTGPTDGNQNYIKIDKLAFDPVQVEAGDTLTITLNMDLNEWIENPVTYDFHKFGKGIMRNQQAQDILKKNGKTVYSVKKVEILK